MACADLSTVTPSAVAGITVLQALSPYFAAGSRILRAILCHTALTVLIWRGRNGP